MNAIHLTPNGLNCEPAAKGHCITCSDEALRARVLRVDRENSMALVAVEDATEEIDISLVESVAPGDLVLMHGGVALASLEEESDA